MRPDQHTSRQRIGRIPRAVLRAQAAEAARRARRHLILIVPLVALLLMVYVYRRELLGLDEPVRLATAVMLVALGLALARDAGRWLQPSLERRLDPSTAGAAGFLIRLFTVAFAVLISLRLAGIRPGTLAAGAGFTAIVLGLAAQQTIGNFFAGAVLLSARPFQVGDRVRFNGLGMDVEGTVVSHGLLYLTLREGGDLVLVPNNSALTMAARPLREPPAVDMRARLPSGVDPEAVQRRVAEAVTVGTRYLPNIVLEEFDGDEVVMRVRATPSDHDEGGRLAREVLDAVAGFADPDNGVSADEGAGERLSTRG